MDWEHLDWTHEISILSIGELVRNQRTIYLGQLSTQWHTVLNSRIYLDLFGGILNGRYQGMEPWPIQGLRSRSFGFAGVVGESCSSTDGHHSKR